MKVLTFDLECRRSPSDPGIGWKNYDAMGISFACAYLDWLDEYRLYTEDDLLLLVADMLEADVITGFNILKFDFPLLEAAILRNGWRVVSGWGSILAKVYDPMQEICLALRVTIPKGWNLDNVAKSNLTITKNGDGAHAPKLYAEQKWGRLGTYVIQDVKVEWHLFRHCRRHGSLKNIFIKMGEPVVVELKQMAALLERFPLWDAGPVEIAAKAAAT